ncbi:hypothetical protein BH11PSE13_BH11PSE13_16340 [soil metagenome]
MTRQTRANRRRNRARRELAGKGWTAVVAGIVLLAVVPSFLHGPVASALIPALRPAGWAALAIGLALLCLHYFSKRGASSAEIAGTQAKAGLKETMRPTPIEPAMQESTAVSVQPAARQEQWSPAVFAAIEWRRFEAVCETFFAQAGLATRSQSHGADGGVDIWLQSKHMDAPRIVQCKHWQGKPVGVKEVREFRGVMASHQLQSGTYVTSSTFTADAIAFAKANGISLQDGAALLKQINLRTPEQQAALLAVAYEGDYWRPTCASCGIKMIEKARKRDGAAFWGCSNYPRCKTKFAIRH